MPFTVAFFRVLLLLLQRLQNILLMRFIIQSSLPDAMKKLFGPDASLNQPWGQKLKDTRRRFLQVTSPKFLRSYCDIAIKLANDIIPSYSSSKSPKSVDISQLTLEYSFLFGSEAFLGTRLPVELIKKVEAFSEGFGAILTIA